MVIAKKSKSKEADRSVLPLKLMAIAGNSQAFLTRLSAPKYDQCLNALQKKQSSCYFCQTQVNQYYIVNIDHNYSNNKMDNMALACHFCSYVQLMDLAQLNDYPQQEIIYLPHKSQAELNRHYHQWQHMMLERSGLFDIKEAIAELTDLKQHVGQLLGFQGGFDDYLGLFSQNYVDNHSLLSHLRWLPSVEFLAQVYRLR